MTRNVAAMVLPDSSAVAVFKSFCLVRTTLTVTLPKNPGRRGLVADTKWCYAPPANFWLEVRLVEDSIHLDYTSCYQGTTI